jgi:hypothetical protein
MLLFLSEELSTFVRQVHFGLVLLLGHFQRPLSGSKAYFREDHLA